MTKTIEAPASMGATVAITGDEVGQFIVHPSGDDALVVMRDVPTWRVTLTRTGHRFPWDFMSKEAATRFATEAEQLHDWSAVAGERPKDGPQHVATWSAGKPDAETQQKIGKLARECGAVKS